MDVFLDYHGVDLDEAQQVARALEAAGRTVLLDEGSVVPERAWLRAVGDQGLRTPFLIVLITPRTPRDWILAHEGLAVSHHAWAARDGRSFTVIPVIIGGRGLDEQSSLRHWPTAEIPAPPELARPALENLGRQLDRWAYDPGVDADALFRVVDQGPFPGLRAFNEARATLFMGRDEAIRQCMERILDEDVRWLQVEGASGVGKTSFVRAGLLVALRVGERSPFGRSWASCLVRPGGQPVYDLALALHKALGLDADHLPPYQLAERLVGDENALGDLIENELPRLGYRGLVLVLDQIDDAFTQQPLAPHAFEPLDKLIARTVMSSKAFRLITTVRSDRLDDFRTLPQLEGLLNLPTTARYHLAPLREDELRAAIVDPIHLVGAGISDDLVEALVHLALPEESRLAKLAVVLRALWADAVARNPRYPVLAMEDLDALRARQARPADQLEEPYEGLRNVFSRVMDRAIEGLSDAELEAARDMLVHVVRPGRAQDMRCMRPRGEVIFATEQLSAKKARRVLEKLAGPSEGRRPTGLEPFRVIERIDTEGDSESLDLRHDVLLTDWRILAVWLEEAREFLERRDELMLVEARPDPFADGPPNEPIVVRLVGEDLDRTTKARYYKSLDDRSRAFIEELKRRRPEPVRPGRVPRWVFAAGAFAVVALIAASVSLFQYQRRLADDNRMKAVKIADTDLASHAARILLAGVRRPQHQEAWADGVVSALEEPAVRRSLVGSTAEIIDLASSADGSLVAAGYGDGTVAWWSLDDPTVTAQVAAHRLAVRAVAVAPDGTWLVSASHDGTATIVRLDGSADPVVLEGHEGPINDVAIGPKGRRILTASNDGTARVWNADGTLEGVLRGHQGWVTQVSVSPDGRRLLTAGKDGTARVWTLSGGRYVQIPEEATILDHRGQWVPVARFSPGGGRILTGAASGELRLWTFDEDGNPVAEVLGRHDRGIVSAEFDQTGERVVSTGRDETVKVWPLGGGSSSELDLEGVLPVAAAFAPSSNDVLVAVSGGEVRRWTPGRDSARIRYGSGRTEVRDLLVIADPPELVTGTADGVARVWDLDQRLVPEALAPDDLPVASAWFGEGDRLFAALVDGGARIFDRATGELSDAIIEGQLEGAGIAPGGQYVATTLDGRVQLWDIQQFAPPKSVGPSDVEVASLAFGPTGDVLGVLGTDGVLRLYRASSGSEIRTVRLRRENVVTFDFDPEGGRVVTGGSNGSVDVWNVEGGISIKRFDGVPGPVSAVAMAEERVVAGADRLARVWSLADAEFVSDLAGHQGVVRDVAISDDEGWVLTVADDRAARLWDVERPASPVRRSREGCSAFQAALLSDGPQVAVACRNGPAELWKPSGAAMQLSRNGTTVAQVTFSADGDEVLTTSDEGPIAIWPASEKSLQTSLLDGVEPCLAPPERVRYLNEDVETAWARWRGCATACWGQEFPDDVVVEGVRCLSSPTE